MVKKQKVINLQKKGKLKIPKLKQMKKINQKKIIKSKRKKMTKKL